MVQDAAPTGEHGPFKVVFVCTGNRARSALAEALYRRYAGALPTTVTSYGTVHSDGAPPLAQATKVAAQLGVDLTRHRSRSLAGVSLRDADLVLCFEVFHVSAAVIETGAPPASSFLLEEFVRLIDADGRADTDPAERARLQVALADARRVRSRPDSSAIISDPVGHPESVMLRIAQRIDELMQDLVGTLFIGEGSERRDEPKRFANWH